MPNQRQGEVEMAQFRGTVDGNRGGASRLGTKASGLDTTANGWNTGARVVLTHNDETGKDVVRVYRTYGSNAHRSSVLIAEWHEGEGTVGYTLDGSAQLAGFAR
jgi:hypothetical protein